MKTDLGYSINSNYSLNFVYENTELNALWHFERRVRTKCLYRLNEEDNFDNVNETAEPLPTGYPIDGSVDFNERIAELSEATGTQIGPSIVLPVRRGDKVSLSTRYFYEEVGEGTTYDNVNLLVNEILMSLATSGSGVLQLNETQLIDIASGSGDYGSAIMNLLSSNFDTSDVSRPNSYLIWMLYDNNMRLIPEGSGAKRVSNPNELGALIEDEIPALTDGYLHCFVSNSAVQPVSYDNFLVSYLRGKTRQINHYYPGGSIMPGRSFNAGAYRYGGAGGQEMDNEISGVGNSYTAEYWQYDPRLVRRWNVDPITYPWQSSYAAFNNNPIIFVDPLGLYGTKREARRARRQARKDGMSTGDLYQTGDDWAFGASDNEGYYTYVGTGESSGPSVLDKVSNALGALDAMVQGNAYWTFGIAMHTDDGEWNGVTANPVRRWDFDRVWDMNWDRVSEYSGVLKTTGKSLTYRINKSNKQFSEGKINGQNKAYDPTAGAYDPSQSDSETKLSKADAKQIQQQVEKSHQNNHQTPVVVVDKTDTLIERTQRGIFGIYVITDTLIVPNGTKPKTTSYNWKKYEKL